MTSLSYSSLGEYRRCGYRFYTERVLGLPPVADPRSRRGMPAGGEATTPRSGADRGVLLHALLERLDFRRPIIPSAEAIRAAAARAGLSPAPGPQETDGIATIMRRFAECHLRERLARAGRVGREERFTFALGPAAGQTLVTGAFDVLATEPGHGVLVVDYKSDRLGDAAPGTVVAAQYATQQLIYALAALRTGAETVEIAHCFLERPEDPVVAAFTAVQAPDLVAELEALAAGVLQRRFEVAPDPHRHLCEGCPAENGLCSWPAAMTRRESPDRLF